MEVFDWSWSLQPDWRRRSVFVPGEGSAGSAGSVKVGSPQGLLISLLPLIAHCCQEETEPDWRRPSMCSGLFTAKVRTFSRLLLLLLRLIWIHSAQPHWKLDIEGSEDLPLCLLSNSRRPSAERETRRFFFSMWWVFAGLSLGQGVAPHSSSARPSELPDLYLFNSPVHSVYSVSWFGCSTSSCHWGGGAVSSPPWFHLHPVDSVPVFGGCNLLTFTTSTASDGGLLTPSTCSALRLEFFIQLSLIICR